MKSVVIEDGQEEIEFEQPYATQTKSYCFEKCPLENVYIGRNLKYAKIPPFRDMETIKHIEFGNNVTSVLDNSFYGCKNLETVIFSNSITEIGYSAFYGCEQLESTSFPNCLIAIGESAFYGCKSLKKVVIPNNVINLGRNAFVSCDNLEEVIIEDGTKILAFGVNYSSSLCFSGPIKKIYLGRNVTCYHSPFIGIEVPFELTIGGTVTKLSEGVFSKCNGISKLIIESDSTPLVFDKFYYTYDSTFMPFTETPIDTIYLDREIKSTDYYNTNSPPCPFAGVPSVSSLIIGKRIDIIAKGLFDYNFNIVTLSIPQNIKKIEACSFQNCLQLSSVIIEDGEDALDFDYGKTFAGCQLRYLYIGRNVNYVKNNSPFKYKGETLTTINFGEYVTEISDSEFLGLKGVKTITFPNSLKKISAQAFYGCEGLTEITIPGSVEEIYEKAFDLCRNIKKITFTDGTEALAFTSSSPNILNNAFANSPIEEIYMGRNFIFDNSSPLSLFESLRYLTIGENVTKIDAMSYICSPNLKDVTSYSKVVPATNGNVFTPSYLPTAFLYVPQALSDEYKVANVWKDFGKITNLEDVHNLICIVDGVIFKKYKIETGNKIADVIEPKRDGYVFSGWNDLPGTMPNHDVIITGSFAKIGDSNNDGDVSITDAVGIVNYILGNQSADFNIKAANINGDLDESGEPKITITDAVGVVNIILNNGSASAPAMEAPDTEPVETCDPE